MPFQFQQQGKGVFEIAAANFPSSICDWKKSEDELLINNSFVSYEPSSVLHMRRSPSPPTSASTLSSSFNGGGGGDNTTTTTPLLPETSPVGPDPPSSKDNSNEWACELQSIPSGGLEAITGSGGGRCGGGIGMEDWETMLSETPASPGQDHSLLRWISGDADDPSFGLKQLLQTGNNSLEFDGNAGLGIVDQGPGLDHIGSSVSGHNLGFSGGGGGFNGTSSSGPLNYKVSNFGTLNNNVGNISHGLGYQQNHPQQHQLENPDEKPQILNPQLFINQHQSQLPHQNPSFFMPVTYAQQEQHFLQSQPKRHNLGGGHGRGGTIVDPSSQIHRKVPFCDPGHEFLLRKQHLQQQPLHGNFPPGMQFLPQQHHIQPRPLVVPKQKAGSEEMAAAAAVQKNQQQQQQLLLQNSLLEQLYKAAEMIGTGNFSHAQAILARLNHQLSPVGKPLQRAAFYFKEALQFLLLMNNPATSAPPRTPTPFDVIFKMGAYKVFSEVSPMIQFVNFTCNQALLEAVAEADQIHIVDFDIGFGAHWASFMQELPLRNSGGASPSLKITAFASPSTHHTVELGLMRDNLIQFANEIGLAFELEVVNIDLLDQNSYSLPFFRANDNEAVAVNFPIWCSSNQPAALPNLLRFVKQLSPKIVVSLDRGCDRSDLPFPQHILQALQSYINLLESLDSINVSPDAVNKIEKFLLQPKIESTVLGRLRTPDKMPLWKAIFASAGFTPLSFSNFTETQAECVVKRSTARGFHVEKRQESLVLCWQRRELISASAWRC